MPRTEVFLFADLMYYRIVIVENIQAQYFDNLTSTGVFSPMTIWLCIKFANTNALFLATFSEPILVLSEQRNGKQHQLTDLKRCFLPQLIVFFILFYDVGYPPCKS